jgi:inhibitor of KinA
MSPDFPYKIYPLGDSAISIDFGNSISRRVNDRVMALYQYLQAQPLPGITDIVPAYSSLTLCYNMTAWLPQISKGWSVFNILRAVLEAAIDECPGTTVNPERAVQIPVCYDGYYAPDLDAMAIAADMAKDKIISTHTAGLYHVYMIGFLPGFAYMGEVDETIAMPRKSRPQAISAGSVGIAGRQTGIYPLDSPGGWQIIGRTPLSMFNITTGETLLKPGDQVQFYPIDSNEFEHY